MYRVHFTLTKRCTEKDQEARSTDLSCSGTHVPVDVVVMTRNCSRASTISIVRTDDQLDVSMHIARRKRN